MIKDNGSSQGSTPKCALKHADPNTSNGVSKPKPQETTASPDPVEQPEIPIISKACMQTPERLTFSCNLALADATAHAVSNPTPSARDRGDNSKELSPHVAMAKFKAVVQDVIDMLSNPFNAKEIDTFIKLTEETLQDLKKVKVKNRQIRVNQSVTDSLPNCITNDTDVENVVVIGAKPGAKSYAAVVTKMNKSKASPKKEEELGRRLAESANVVEKRANSSAAAELRRQEAESRRIERQEEQRVKVAKAHERIEEVKQKQKEDEERIREETREKAERVAKRLEENKQKVKEKAQKHSQRVDEVLFVNEINHQNKAMRLEVKIVDAEHIQEAIKESHKQVAKERTEAHQAVLGRSKELTQQKVEKAQQRELHRQEQLKRLEEQKKAEAESKHQKAEEREKKVQQHQQSAQADAENRKAKIEERLSQCQQNREEIRSQQAAKRKENEQKARERREGEDPTVKISLLPMTAEEEQAQSARLLKVSASFARQGKLFVDQYQKESEYGVKDLNKGRFRHFAKRLAIGGALSRQPLVEMGQQIISSIDFEYTRYFNMFEIIMQIFVEALKSEDYPTFKAAGDFLHLLFLNETEAAANIRYFVRAGHMLPLLTMTVDELNQCKDAHSMSLTYCFSLLQLCVTCITTDVIITTKCHSIKDQLADLLELALVDKYCFALTSTNINDEDMSCLQYILLIMGDQITLKAKRQDVTPSWFETVVISLFTLLQSILSPQGHVAGQDNEPHIITPKTMLVIFTCFRLLNSIIRLKPAEIGKMLREEDPARTQLFHMTSAFFAYLSDNVSGLERIPTDVIDTSGCSKTFEDAQHFGITLPNVPRASLPKFALDCTVILGNSYSHSLRSNASKASGLGFTGEAEGCTQRAALHEILLFWGIASLAEPKVQEIMSWGKERSLLAVILSTIPFNYFTLAKHIFFPTLASFMIGNDTNRLIAEKETDLSSIGRFIKGEIDILPEKRQNKIKASELPPPVTKKFITDWADITDDGDDEVVVSDPLHLEAKEQMLKQLKSTANYAHYFKLENRIPTCMWHDAARSLGGIPAEETNTNAEKDATV